MAERWVYERIVKDLIEIGREEERLLESLEDMEEALEYAEEIWRWIEDLIALGGISDNRRLYDIWDGLRMAIEYEDYSTVEDAIEDLNEEIARQVGFRLSSMRD